MDTKLSIACRAKLFLALAFMSISWLTSAERCAWAGENEDRADCVQMADLERKMRGCTGLIEAESADQAGAYSNRGMIYGMRGEVDRAIADFNAAIGLDPNNYAAHYNLGASYLRKGESGKALQSLSNTIHLNPSYVDAHVMRGVAHYMRNDDDLAIADYSEGIRLNPSHILAFSNRGTVYGRKGEHARALADYNEAIRLKPDYAEAYLGRCLIFAAKGDNKHAFADCNTAAQYKPDLADAYVGRGHLYKLEGKLDLAMADLNKSISLNPSHGKAYAGRSEVYTAKGAHELALADLNTAVRLMPSAGGAYNMRAWFYYKRGLFAQGKTDADEAVRLSPREAVHFNTRAHIHLSLGQTEAAIVDFSQTIGLGVKSAAAFAGRGQAYERQGLRDLALSDYRKALELEPKADDSDGRAAKSLARERIAALEAPKSAAAAVTAALGQASAPGRRIALVVGMSAYASVPALANPRNDGKSVAEAFRRLGFAEVVERYDLDLASLSAVLKDFGDKAAEADWAVIFYAGHGVEVDGVNYLVPVDAKLAAQSHVEFELLPLARLLAVAEPARKLRLVILDACRNNPFRMAAAPGRTRSIGRGLSRVEPGAGVLVAYAARDGSVAEDGADTHSPFTAGLLAHLETPGLEINLLFRKVRSAVLSATGNKQEPFVYGSLPDEGLYFKGSPR